MDMFDREKVKVVYKEQENASLVEKLKSFREYILNDGEPEWKQIIAIGGFVADVVKLLKWTEKPVYDCRGSYTSYLYNNEHVMSCEDIIASLWQAIDYTFQSPHADEFNAMWQDFHFNNTGKFADVETMDEMYDIFTAKIEEEYPQFMETVLKYWHFDEE